MNRKCGVENVPVQQCRNISITKNLLVTGVPIHLPILQQQRPQRLLVNVTEAIARRLPHCLERPLPDHQLLEPSLGLGGREEVLLHGSLGREAVDDDGACLADSVTTVLSLEVLLGVPVTLGC